jgi:hypothetical protein
MNEIYFYYMIDQRRKKVGESSSERGGASFYSRGIIFSFSFVVVCERVVIMGRP